MKLATGSRSAASWGKNFTTTLDPLPVHQGVVQGCLCVNHTTCGGTDTVLPTLSVRGKEGADT